MRRCFIYSFATFKENMVSISFLRSKWYRYDYDKQAHKHKKAQITNIKQWNLSFSNSFFMLQTKHFFTMEIPLWHPLLRRRIKRRCSFFIFLKSQRGLYLYDILSTIRDNTIIVLCTNHTDGNISCKCDHHILFYFFQTTLQNTLPINSLTSKYIFQNSVSKENMFNTTNTFNCTVRHNDSENILLSVETSIHNNISKRSSTRQIRNIEHHMAAVFFFSDRMEKFVLSSILFSDIILFTTISITIIALSFKYSEWVFFFYWTISKWVNDSAYSR